MYILIIIFTRSFLSLCIRVAYITDKHLKGIAQLKCRISPSFGTMEIWFHYSTDPPKKDAIPGSGIINISFIVSAILTRSFNRFLFRQFSISLFDTPTRMDPELKRMFALIPKIDTLGCKYINIDDVANLDVFNALRDAYTFSFHKERYDGFESLHVTYDLISPYGCFVIRMSSRVG